MKESKPTPTMDDVYNCLLMKSYECKYTHIFMDECDDVIYSITIIITKTNIVMVSACCNMVNKNITVSCLRNFQVVHLSIKKLNVHSILD